MNVIELGNVVRTPDGAIGSVTDWVDHGMRPGIFTIEWDYATCAGQTPQRHWTREEAAILTVLS